MHFLKILNPYNLNFKICATRNIKECKEELDVEQNRNQKGRRVLNEAASEISFYEKPNTKKEKETWFLKCPFQKYPMCLMSNSNNSFLKVENIRDKKF